MQTNFIQRYQLALAYHQASRKTLRRLKKKINKHVLPEISRISIRIRITNGVFDYGSTYDALGLQLKAASCDVIHKYIALEETILADLGRPGADTEKRIAEYNAAYPRHMRPTYSSRAGIEAARTNAAAGLEAFKEGYLKAMDEQIARIRGGPPATLELRATKDLARVVLDTVRIQMLDR